MFGQFASTCVARGGSKDVKRGIDSSVKIVLEAGLRDQGLRHVTRFVPGFPQPDMDDRMQHEPQHPK